jgi:hypothetical protein
MKTWIVISLLGTIPAFAKAPMRDVTGHDELALKHRKAAQEDPMGKLAAAQRVDPGKGVVPAKPGVPVKPGVSAKPADPAKPDQPRSLLDQSDIISFNGVATLVPKRAIIQVPKNLKSRITYEPGAKLMHWADFYALNRAWITTIEVSEAQAEGNNPLAEETQQKMVKSGALIIATFKGGPISVLPLKVPPPEETQTPNPKPKS